MLTKQLIKDVRREYGTEHGDDADYYLIPSTGASLLVKRR